MCIRDSPKTGQPDQSPEAFAPFLKIIKQRSNCVINLTTGGAPTMTVEERVKPAATYKPEVASLNMGTMNFGLYPMIPRFKGKFKHDWEEPYLEGSRKGFFKNTLADIDAASRDDGELAALKQRSEEIESARTELLSRRTENEQRQAQARQSLSEMETIVQRAEALRADAADLSARAEEFLAENGDPYLTVTINHARYDTWRAAVEADLATLRAEHDTYVRDFEVQEDARRQNGEALAAADSARERARQRVLQSEERVAALVGDENDGESLNGLKALRTRITEAPDRMDQVRDEIIEHAGRIHAALRAQLDAVDSLYAPASCLLYTSDAADE